MSFYGQFNTDYYISKYFDTNYKGICIDVGMSEPIGSNNTYHFEQKGWTCLCIEPNPRYCEMAKGVRQKVENVACGKISIDHINFDIITLDHENQGAISSLKIDRRLIESHKHLITNIKTIKVNVRTLDDILKNHLDITQIDFISIDTEDTELDVLKGFDINRWKPKLMVIENNFNEPFIEDYLKQFNYKKHERIAINDFYILDK